MSQKTAVNPDTDRKHILEVTDLKVHTAGGVIGPGEVVMEVVPSSDRLIVDANMACSPAPDNFTRILEQIIHFLYPKQR